MYSSSCDGCLIFSDFFVDLPMCITQSNTAGLTKLAKNNLIISIIFSVGDSADTSARSSSPANAPTQINFDVCYLPYMEFIWGFFWAYMNDGLC